MQVTLHTVQKRNAFNNLLNFVERDLITILGGWSGQKIWKVSGNGGMAAKFKKAVELYTDSKGYRDPETDVFVHLVVRHNCLLAFVRNRRDVLSADIYLGRTDEDGNLSRIDPPLARRTDYTVEAVQHASDRAYQLETEARSLRSSISDFTAR